MYFLCRDCRRFPPITPSPTPPTRGTIAKLNWDNDGSVQFIATKSQVRHRFTRYTYTLTDDDKKGLLNIKQVKIVLVQKYSETNVCLKEIGKKWTFNIGGIFRNQSVPLVSPTEAPSRRRVPIKKGALVAIEDKNEAIEEPPSPV